MSEFKSKLIVVGMVLVAWWLSTLPPYVTAFVACFAVVLAIFGLRSSGEQTRRLKALEETLERESSRLADVERRTRTPEEKEQRDEAERRATQMKAAVLARYHASPTPPRPDVSGS